MKTLLWICSTFLLLSITLLQAQNFWEHTGAPQGGEAVSMIEADNGDILLGTSEGTFRSTDAGANWALSENGMVNHYNTDLFKHASGDIYACGFNRLLGCRLYRSTDNGVNWVEIPNLPLIPATSPTQLVVVNSNGDIFVGGTTVGSFIIARSTDNGANWTTVFSPSGVFGMISDLAINSNGDLFVAVSGDVDRGIHRSTDNGDNWTQVFADKAAGVYVHTNDDIYIISRNSVLISTDNGGNWTEIYNLSSLPGFGDTPYSLTVNTAGDIFVGTSPGVGGDGIGRSTDGGATWSLINTSLPGSNNVLFNHPTVNLLFNHSGGQLLCGFSSFFTELSAGGGIGGVYSSTDNGDNWTESNSGLLAVSFTKVMVHSGGDVFAISSMDDISSPGLLHSNDNGATWTDRSPLVFGAPFDIYAYTENQANGDIFAGGPFSLQHSTDLGNNWNEVGGGYFSGHTVAGISTNSGGDIFVASNGGIYRSTDNGANWTQVYQGNTKNVFVAPNGYVYMLGFVPGGLYRSTDNGDNWTQLTNGISGGVSDLAIAPDNTLYAVDGDGIYRSGDLGDSWASADNGIPKGSSGIYMFTVYNMAVNSAGHVYASIKYLDAQDVTQYNVFRTTDSGNNWSILTSSGLIGSYTIIYGLSIGSDDRAYAAAVNGIYRSAQSTVGINDEEKLLPVSFRLEQNYPNPFNPETTILFTLPKTQLVALKVYDVSGRKVATLVNGRVSAGRHETKFDGKQLASGLYFYQLKTSGFLQTRKMLLVK